MAINPSHSQALDALEASVNSILLQTGSSFCDSSNFETWRIMRTNAQLKNSMPNAMSRFHDALDSLEGELIRARAVLQRDFTALRQSQMIEDVKPSPAIIQRSQDTQDEDVLMMDAQQLPSGVEEEVVASDSPVREKTPTIDVIMEPSAPPKDPSPEVEQMPLKPSTQQFPQEEVKVDGEVQSTATTQQPSTKPAENHVEDTPSIDKGTSANPFNLDSAQTAPGDLFTQDDPFSTPLNNQFTPNDAALSTNDVGSLLPGLEFYANDSNAEDMDSFANLTSGGQAFESMNTGDLAQDMLEGQQTMNFDDFFANFGVGGGDTEAVGQGVAMGVGDDTNFDESFFNLDAS